MRGNRQSTSSQIMAVQLQSNKVALVKIAPGHAAEYWPQCLKEGYICVGWDAVGDLRRFDSEAKFRAVFEKHYKYHGSLSTARRKANELWALTKLQSGDRVIANKGMDRVLAVGVVQEPAYEWRPDRSRGEYYHTVRVKWDTSFGGTIPKQPWRQTLTEISYGLFKKIVGRTRLSRDSVRSLRDGWDDCEPTHRGWTNVSARTSSSAEKKRERCSPGPEARKRRCVSPSKVAFASQSALRLRAASAHRLCASFERMMVLAMVSPRRGS
jgi:hypothetical protein